MFSKVWESKLINPTCNCETFRITQEGGKNTPKADRNTSNAYNYAIFILGSPMGFLHLVYIVRHFYISFLSTFRPYPATMQFTTAILLIYTSAASAQFTWGDWGAANPCAVSDSLYRILHTDFLSDLASPRHTQQLQANGPATVPPRLFSMTASHQPAQP